MVRKAHTDSGTCCSSHPFENCKSLVLPIPSPVTEDRAIIFRLAVGFSFAKLGERFRKFRRRLPSYGF